MNDYTIYPILPLCNSTNVFSLHGDHTDISQSKYLYLMMGLCVVERVPNDPNHFLYKLLIARLRTAGFKYSEIRHVFKVSENTIRKWAKTLREGSGEAIAQVFGLVSRGKLTDEIREKIKRRYRVLRGSNTTDYRKVIREEILDGEDISISGEALRRIFRKADLDDARSDASPSSWTESESSQSPPSDPVSSVGDNSQQPVEPSLPSAHDGGVEPVACSLSPQDPCAELSVKDAELRNKSAGNGDMPTLPVMPTSGQRIPARSRSLHHIGLFLFLADIHSVGTRLGANCSACLQLVSQLLLGAVNVEQGKLLSTQALEFMIGSITGVGQDFRTKLDQYASREGVATLVKENLRLAGLLDALSLTLYYDPHGKHYTGDLPILKGWCGNLKDTAKVLYSDYIHSEEGFPLFMKHYDNFYDLRERILFTLYEFASYFEIIPEMTIVVDRGIYGLSTMLLFTRAGYKLITWEKDYNRDGWDDAATSQTFIWKRPRNNADDLKTYSFDYQEGVWATDPSFRRIITRATNPKGNTVEVSILSSNQSLTAERIIKLIFNRWIQENDFRYLIEHYGIDELDSRAAITYAEDTPVNDRLVESRVFHNLQKERKKVTERIKKLLLNKENKLKTLTNSQAKRRAKSYADIGMLLEDIKTVPADTLLEKKADKQLARIEKKIQKHQQITDKLEHELARREEELGDEIRQAYQLKTDIETQLADTMKDESRLATLVEQRYVYLDTTRKSVMDMCRIIARNIFYLNMQNFRPIYRNFRDDHDVMRTLADASGTIAADPDGITITLWPKPEYGGVQRERLEVFLTAIAVKTEKWVTEENQRDVRVSIVLNP